MTEPTIASIALTQEKTLLVVEHLSDKVAERIEHTDAWRERTDLIIMGDGNGRKGHNVRIDRLEQKIAAQMWVIRALAGGLIALVIKAAASLL